MRKKEKPEVFVAQSRQATLVLRGKQLVCKCPYACLATFEQCEFAAREDWKRQAERKRK